MKAPAGSSEGSYLGEDMKNRKLAYFDFVTHYGGSQRCTVLLCRELRQFNELQVIDAYGVCRDYIEALGKYNIPTHMLLPDARMVYIGHKGKIFKRTWSLTRQICTLLELRRGLIGQILQINPELIWTNSTKALVFLATSLRLRKYPIVTYAHGWYRESQVPAFRRWLIRKADGVLAVSNPTAKSLESWGVQKEKIHVVYNSIDFDEVLEDSRKELLTSPPQIDKSFKILLPGQLLRTKGQHTAIEAAGLLKKKGLDFVMWLAGDVKMGVGDEYRQHLQKTIGDYGLEDNVFLLGFREDVRALMRLSDVVILPTHSEGLPCVVEESMILRRPVISTPVGGVTDLIIDGETGLIVPVDDTKALAQSIEKLMLDKELRNRIAQKASEHMYKNFSLDKQIETLSTVFENIIKNR